MFFTNRLSQTAVSYVSWSWWERLLFPYRRRNCIAANLLKVFEISSYRHYTAYELARDLGISDINGQCALYEALRLLVLKGEIEQIYPGKFRLHASCRIVGVVDLSLPGKAMLLTVSHDRPVHILPGQLRGASHGDTVLVSIVRKTHLCLEAKVLRIHKHAERNLVGTLEVSSHRAYFTPLNQYLYCDIEIPLKHIKNAQDGDSVVIKLCRSVQKNKRRMSGKVVRVLGEADLQQVKNKSFLHSNRFPTEFLPEEEKAAAEISFTISRAEIAKRVDMRNILTVTIDPADAKDIDDAISFRPLENGNFEIGVHIADVSHYIQPDSILDKSAYERTTSVYLTDRVLPMFPHTFTRGCSLSPKVDKLAFSVILEIDGESKVIRHQIAKTVIHSQKQFSYEQVQKLIDKPKNDALSQTIHTLYTLAMQLREQRFKNGAITFKDHSKLTFDCDHRGQAINVTPRFRSGSMYLIEEFMLLANRTIAETAAQKHVPFIYRTHGSPKLKMINELCSVAANYGYKIWDDDNKFCKNNRSISKNLSRFLSQLKTVQEESLFTHLSIRSMSQGKYSSVPRRHFALSFDHYTHFTSPLRRYVDLQVHRLVARTLINPTEATGIFDYEAACIHFNTMRQKAKLMEQCADQQKSVEFLRTKAGSVLDGIIIYVTHSHLLVELSPWGIRGRLLLKSMRDDYYQLDYSTYILHGRNTGKRYQAGDKIQVRVLYAENDVLFSLATPI